MKKPASYEAGSDCQKNLSGGLEGPQALQSEFVSPGFAGRAGSLRPLAQTFLKHLAEKAAAGGLFRQTEPASYEAGYLRILSTPKFGGDKRDRTADLLNAIQALSQLSYTPK